MALEVNGARGEVLLDIGGEEIVIAATMNGLSVVSTRLECKSLQDLFLRLSGTELAATQVAISALAVRGDPTKALAKLKLKHFPAIAEAFSKALSHHFDDDDVGNGEAVKGK